ncbi:hypothetical protein [Corynebacterium kalidii]
MFLDAVYGIVLSSLDAIASSVRLDFPTLSDSLISLTGGLVALGSSVTALGSTGLSLSILGS